MYRYGQFDLAGFAKAAAHWYRAWWLSDTPETLDDRPPVGGRYSAHIVELWDADSSSDTRTIHGYTNAQFSELFVNGKSQGVQMTQQLQGTTWDNVRFAAFLVCTRSTSSFHRNNFLVLALMMSPFVPVSVPLCTSNSEGLSWCLSLSRNKRVFYR